MEGLKNVRLDFGYETDGKIYPELFDFNEGIWLIKDCTKWRAVNTEIKNTIMLNHQNIVINTRDLWTD